MSSEMPLDSAETGDILVFNKENIINIRLRIFLEKFFILKAFLTGVKLYIGFILNRWLETLLFTLKSMVMFGHQNHVRSFKLQHHIFFKLLSVVGLERVSHRQETNQS